ncbi:hypothetical protein [Microbacterium sp. P01]|uniref:hypothetical protein n=1 Tax=unclassified Microbacterium TaxID=2609290 RepID=UPI00366D6130
MAAHRFGGNVYGKREYLLDEELLDVSVRRAPRIGRFLGMGIVLGLLASTVLTVASGMNEAAGGIVSSGPSGVLLVFGVLSAVCIGIGLVIFGGMALVLDRMMARTLRHSLAERATTLTDDLDTPSNDDLPKWVRDHEELS